MGSFENSVIQSSADLSILFERAVEIIEAAAIVCVSAGAGAGAGAGNLIEDIFVALDTTPGGSAFV